MSRKPIPPPPFPVGRGGVFPLSYLAGLLDFIAGRREQIELITYDDLPWGADTDYQHGYPDERRRWLEQRDPEKVHVLLQHDVDSRPERSLAVLAEEDRRSLRSVAMVFARRLDRRKLRDERCIEYTEYDIAPDYLRRLAGERRFTIGYHCNAVEQARWDPEAAAQRFRADLTSLREIFEIRFFSAHGGVSGPDGMNNSSLIVPEDLRSEVRWVCTGHGARFDGSYSDGGIRNPRRDIATRDLRTFVRSWRPGGRYRVLTHPQYYTDDAQPADELLRADWYRGLFDDPAGFWAEVELAPH